MATFTPLESTKDLPKRIARGRGHAYPSSGRPLGVVIDRTCRVYINHIPLERMEQEGANALRREFEAYGPLESYKLFTDKSGRFLGTALATYRNPADARLAIAGMHNRTIAESTLAVSLASEHGVMLLYRRPHRGFLSDAEDEADNNSNNTHFDKNKIPGQGWSDDEDEEADGEGERGKEKEGRWQHDKYALLAEGREMAEVLGLQPTEPSRGGRRGGRADRGNRGRGRGSGRGGFGSYERSIARVEREFERYITERDRKYGQAPSTTAAPDSTNPTNNVDIKNTDSTSEPIKNITDGNNHNDTHPPTTDPNTLAREGCFAEDWTPVGAGNEEGSASPQERPLTPPRP